MPSTTDTDSHQTTPKKVLTAVHNLPKRTRSQTLLGQPARPRAPGKENVPPGEEPPSKPRPAAPTHHRRRPAPLLLGRTPTTGHNNKWAPKDGKIIVKVWVPSTDDIWKLRVPEDVRLESFRTRVAAKVGFEVSFSALVCGTLRTIADDAVFREWVEGRVVNGRNSLLTAHRLALA
ncbi:hypothetical protein LXA43DRAFT_1106618 [Ganoderma leucocontextum]|nr:hypothetical protein LXA43DRAFT_1106618 [Ganoderma leucocontextum]